MGILRIKLLVGAHHVGCIGDDGGDVEDIHDLPCNMSIYWNANKLQSTRTAANNICLYIIADFLFLLQVFAKEIFHISQLFLLDSWASSSH